MPDLPRERAETCCGQHIKPPNTQAKFFLGGVTIEILVLIGLTCWTINETSFPLDDNTRYTFAYAFAVLFNCFAVLYFVFDSVLRERKEEMYAFLVATTLTLAYSIYDYCVGCSHGTDCMTRLIVCAIVQPFNVVLAVLMIRDMNWLAYEIAGANEKLQQLYDHYSSFLALLKVDFQCSVTVVILASFSGVLNDKSLILSLLGLWLSIWWLVLARYASRHEHVVLMYFFYAFALLEPVYIVFKIHDIADEFSDVRDLISFPVFVLGAACLVIRVVVLVLAVRVQRAFNHGLKPLLLREPMAATLIVHN